MPLPVPNLDDRRFDDLVEEARARLAGHVPELAHLSPGDPLNALVDLFAWMTETVIYRANLIPERQRRVFLNLLQIPMRPARPARGVVCVDASPTSVMLPPLVRDEARFMAGKLALTGVGDLQPTPLSLQVAIKERLDPEMLRELGISEHLLKEQYGLGGGDRITPYRPRVLVPASERLTLNDSIDKCYYLALSVPRQLQASIETLRQRLAGQTLNIALAPWDSDVPDAAQSTGRGDAAQGLNWALISRDPGGRVRDLPLEVLSDSSRGARRSGVVRLRLPRNPALFSDFATEDPMFAGLGDLPPELVDDIAPERVAFWLRLSGVDDPDLPLGYLDVNALDVLAQGLRRDLIVGIGSGEPDQSVVLPDRNIDRESLELEVEEDGAWVRWHAVDMLAGHDAEARVYRLDAEAGHVFFGDGLSAGRRPPVGRRIRIRRYRHGGGSDGNLPPGSVRELVDGSPRHRVRHAWGLAGGVDAESVEQAEQRIPQFLTHRNRAVTREDFRLLARYNPVAPVARAEVMPGFIPGARIEAHRFGVPGAVSLFVMPSAEPALASAPRPTRRMLKDVFDYLVPRVLIGTELYVLSPEFVPIAAGVRVQVRDPQTERQTLQAVRQAVTEYFWALAPGGDDAVGWPMGFSVRLNPLVARVARVEGVLAVNGASLYRRGEAGWHAVGADDEITLEAFQLPELVGVAVERGGPGSPPPLPDDIDDAGSDERSVPVPVIPDVC